MNNEGNKNDENFLTEVLRGLDDSSILQKSRILDTSNNLLYHTETTLVTQPSKQQNFSKIHPLQMPEEMTGKKIKSPSKIQELNLDTKKNDTESGQEETKDKQEKSSFWDRFKGGSNKKPQGVVRKFSILNQNSGILIP